MGRVWGTIGIDHTICIAVICQQKKLISFFQAGFHQLGKAVVHRFSCDHASAENPGMAHHIGVGKIETDKAGTLSFPMPEQGRGNFRSRHLRLQVIGGDFRGGNEDSFLFIKGIFPATRKEKSHVGIFFGFGNPQLGNALP